jgi:hypothetical protein
LENNDNISRRAAEKGRQRGPNREGQAMELLISVSASCDTIERLKSDYLQSTFVKLEGAELDKVMRIGNGKDAGVTTVYMTHNTVHKDQVILQAYGADGCWVGAMKFEQSEYDLLISGDGKNL